MDENYTNLILTMILSTFSYNIYNIYYPFLYYSSYLSIYDNLYINEVFKLSFIFYNFGFFLGGYFIQNLLNLLAFRKSILILLVLQGLFLVILSTNKSMIIFIFFTFIFGIISSLWMLIYYSFNYACYPKKIGIVSGLLSCTSCISFFTINYLSVKIINKNNEFPTRVYIDGNKNKYLFFNKNISDNVPNFLLIIGLINIFLGFILSYFLFNPNGLSSKFSLFIRNKILKVDNFNELYLSNFRTLSEKYSKAYESLRSSFRKDNLSEIELKMINENEDELDLNIKEVHFKRELMGNKFLGYYFNFILIDAVNIFWASNLRKDGLSFYNDNIVVYFGSLFMIINIIVRLSCSFLIKKENINNLLLIGNFIFILSFIIKLKSDNQYTYFLIPYSLSYFGIGIVYTLFTVICKLSFDDSINNELFGIFVSSRFIGSIFNYLIGLLFYFFQINNYQSIFYSFLFIIASYNIKNIINK